MERKLQLLNEGFIFNTFVLYLFIKRLVTPFDQTRAFRLGIIDKDGNVLRKSNTLKTPEERSAFTIFDILIFNLKKLIGKVPGGKSRLATFAAALYLIKEEKELPTLANDKDAFVESFMDFMNEIELDDTLKAQIMKLIDEYEEQNDQGISEDEGGSPINNTVGSGHIAMYDVPLGLAKRKKPKEE